MKSIIYGYAKQYQYKNTGELYIQVRVPNIHGPYSQQEYQGTPIRNYTQDQDLPWYPSLLLPHNPVDGEVVALLSDSSDSGNFIVLGLTGGNYSTASQISS